MIALDLTIDGHAYSIWQRSDGRWIVEQDGYVFAALDQPDHSEWRGNPGLREAIVRQLAAQRMVYL